MKILFLSSLLVSSISSISCAAETLTEKSPATTPLLAKSFTMETFAGSAWDMPTVINFEVEAFAQQYQDISEERKNEIREMINVEAKAFGEGKRSLILITDPAQTNLVAVSWLSNTDTSVRIHQTYFAPTYGTAASFHVLKTAATLFPTTTQFETSLSRNRTKMVEGLTKQGWTEGAPHADRDQTTYVGFTKKIDRTSRFGF